MVKLQVPTDPLVAKRGWTHTASSSNLAKTTTTARFLGSHSALDEESSLVGYHAVTIGDWLANIQTGPMLSSSLSTGSPRRHFLEFLSIKTAALPSRKRR
jgi:hypothetical protein